MQEEFPVELQRELAKIAASVIKTSGSTEAALLSASAQTGASPNQVLAMAISKILIQRLSKESSLPAMMLHGLMYEVGNRALLVLEMSDDAEDEVRRAAEEKGIDRNDLLGTNVAYLVAKWFRGEPLERDPSG
jgi:hypothetical protein